ARYFMIPAAGHGSFGPEPEVLMDEVLSWLVLDAKSTVDENCDAEKRCTPEGLDASESGKTYGIVTTVGLAVGAVGLGVGSYLVLSATPASDERGPSARALIGGRF
ncbi:MAG TPA: hypothetical protein VM686_24520, partial [Polyangiaceae bacterium]|nr:hypothetical protein [Polyangiaceae bacterium]